MTAIFENRWVTKQLFRWWGNPYASPLLLPVDRHDCGWLSRLFRATRTRASVHRPQRIRQAVPGMIWPTQVHLG